MISRNCFGPWLCLARLPRAVLLLAALLLASLLAPVARAELRRDGDWSVASKKVSLSLRHKPRADAIRELAKRAGWSVVLQSPPDGEVDVDVKDQPADRVLDLLLGAGSWVAHRDGDLVSIERVTGAPADGPQPVPPAAPVASAPPPAASVAAAASARQGADDDDDEKALAKAKRHGHGRAHGEDRVVIGESAKIAAGERVGDLLVLGGSCDVAGTVDGDLAVMGGAAKVLHGGVVHGDATAVGGSLTLEKGSRVDGDVGTVGGSLRREPGAEIRGEIADKSELSVGIDVEAGDDADEARPWTSRASHAVGSALTSTSLLFVFGAVLLALATRRMDALEREVAARPMRSFALGVVGLLAGVLLLVLLCVTVIGVPVAIALLLASVLGGYAGICAVLTTVGGALIGHKTKNVYVHLGLGCVLFMLLTPIPWLGDFVTFAVILLGFGSLVATRGAGVFPENGSDAGPYRTPATAP